MNFWEQPLETLDRAQWEALCDGCGKCCLHKVEDADTGDIYPTNVACRLLDRDTARCCDYKHRRALVPDCLRLTRSNVFGLEWLPESCAYRLRARGEALPDWHYLVSGDPEAVHREGHSVRGWTVSEVVAGDLENHIVDRAL
ncbi:MAG: YcgN family cysteine cluster protein [Sphingobium sp.]